MKDKEFTNTDTRTISEFTLKEQSISSSCQLNQITALLITSPNQVLPYGFADQK